METRIKLKNCEFSEAHFKEVNFQDVDFSGDNLTGAVFQNCNLTNVSFKEANLRNVLFKDCDLKKVNFEEANWWGITFYNVKGVYQFGPTDAFGMGFAVDWGDKVMIYFGGDEIYFWGSEDEIIEKINEIYGGAALTLYEQQIKLAAKILEAARK